MFDLLHAQAVIREAGELAAWSGFAGIAVAAGVAVAWFVPILRGPAIAGALIVAAAYGGTLYGNHSGRAGVQAEWDAANAQAAAEAAARDAAIEQKLAADNPAPTPAQEQQANADEQKILAALSAAAAHCELGADALRLRQRK